mgnify:FL=1
MKKSILFASLLATYMLMPASALAQSDVSAEAAEQNTPAGWTAVKLPAIPAITADNTFDITNYGASQDSPDNTKAIQSALNAVPTAGGMVVIPAGTWLCGPIKLKAKTVLHLAAGATLKLLPFGQYPGTVGTIASSVTLQDFISPYNDNANDLIIEGESKETSVIEGQGSDWWRLRDESKPAWNYIKRGCVIRFNTKAQRFLVRNLKIQNAPGVNITVGQSGKGSNCTIHDVVIREPASTVKFNPSKNQFPSHNTDGIPVWADHVNIYNCDISNGDDNVVMDSKAQYVHVWNCQFGTGHGASFGSFTSELHDILYENISFDGTDCGFRLKSQRGRSGSVYNLTMRNCTMKNVNNPISIDAWYDGQPSSPATATVKDSTATTPYFHDILIQNVTSTGTPYNSSKKAYFPIYIYGLPESHVRNITLDNVQVSAAKGMFLAYCDGIKFINGCKITNTRNASKYFETQYKATYTGKYDGSEPTGIQAVEAAPGSHADVYDLSGRLIARNATPSVVSALQPGIYVYGSKKVAVRK